MALNVQVLSSDEVHAVWEALNQYVDNQDDSVDESEWPEHVKARVNAAREMIAHLDAAMALAVEATR